MYSGQPLESVRVTPDEVNAVSGVPFDPVLSAVAASRKQTTVERSSRQTALREVAQSLLSQVSNHQQLLLSIAEEKGVSSWLTADSSFENGTSLNKSDFRDAVCLRYGFPIDGLPTGCV